jgi:integrase
MRCWGLHRVAYPAYLGRFLFSGLLSVALYCVRGGIRVVSKEAHRCFTMVLARSTHATKYVQHLLGHVSIHLTLDRYSQWIPTMGRHAAESMDKALG